MTLDYTKMFLIVTEEAVVKGHFASGGESPLTIRDRCGGNRHFPDPLGNVTAASIFSLRKERFFAASRR